ncbi:MAG: protein kinase domain-containing protein [Candidatus Xenobia bacterium]
MVRVGYRLDRPLRPNGTWQGWDLQNNRAVIIKSARQPAFRQEAELLRRLRHPGLPVLLDFLEERETLTIVLELIPGRDLLAVCDGHPVPEEQALRWMAQLCDVLAYLHEQSPAVIHRDVRPDNLILGDDGQLRLIDFTLAAAPLLRPSGTPAYAPPEQYGNRVDARVDVYGAGATLYHLLTGTAPPPAMAIVTGAAGADPRQRQPGISSSVADAVTAMMRIDASTRPPTIQSLRHLLLVADAPTLSLVGPAGQVDGLLGSLVHTTSGRAVQLLRLLGRGASSVVFEAAPVADPHARVAVKLLLDRTVEDEARRARFERELGICCRLDHPGVVKVYDWGLLGGNLFMVMELVSGQTFHDLARTTTRLPVHQVIDWMMEVLRSLGAAHAAGVIHRDVKPSNLMLTGDGRVKIFDFGIARESGSRTLTSSKMALGTPLYMSPEHFNARDVTPASDIYSAGLVFYELLVGRSPYPDSDIWVLMGQKMLGPPPDVREIRPDVPLPLSGVLQKMLQPDPAQRYATVDAVLSDLVAVREQATRVGSRPLGLQPGDVLQGRYRIEGVLGQGGMGTVYRATHLQLNSAVAVKQLQSHVVDAEMRASAERQFRQEAQILCRLHHPQLPRVYDLLEQEDSHYLVMEYIDGSSLEQAGPAPEAQVLEWAARLCDVLEYLHGQQPAVIFRDLKPSNIMLDAKGSIRLIDFGIAKLLDVGSTGTIARGAASMGYAAPEQYAGVTDARSDIYSLGATLYTLLSGEMPPHAMERAAGTASLAPVGNEQTMQAIEAMLQLKPDQRPQTIADVRSLLWSETVPVTVLRRVQAPRPVPWRLILSGLGGLAVMAIVLVALAVARAGLHSDPVPAPPAPASLEVTSDPAGADVYVEERFQGRTPLVLHKLAAHDYEVRVTRNGYLQAHQEVALTGGQTAHVGVTLQPTPRPTPQPQPTLARPQPTAAPRPTAKPDTTPGFVFKPTVSPSVVVVIPPSPPAGPAGIVPGQGVGKVSLGMTREDLTRLGETPVETQRPRMYRLTGEGILVSFDRSGRVNLIEVHGEALRLANALGVGSSRAEVERAYGAPPQGGDVDVFYRGKELRRYDVAYSALGLGFRYHGTVVKMVVVAPRNQIWSNFIVAPR